MKCIVPLAGPDLEHVEHRFRPLVPHNGRPLLDVALNGRAWRGKLTGADYVFVVREVDGIAELIAWLGEAWPGCRIVRLPALTGGALYSVLAGVAAYEGDAEVLIVDLADIIFGDGPVDPEQMFDPGVGMIVPCFTSDEPCYSYLRTEMGQVVEAAEKRVISDAASAGVYMFRDRAVFLEAAAHSIRHRERLAHKGALFICPMANGVIDAGLRVLAPHLAAVAPAGKAFHR